MATSKKKTSRKKKPTQSKMDQASKIMERRFFQQGKERKDILPVLMEKCDLSKAGASTYYQTIKNRILEDESN